MLIELKNSSTSVRIDTMGAELMSFMRDDGFELLWQGDGKYWSGRAPVLFPIVGALRNGTATIEGKPYKMNQHGFAKDMEFKVKRQSESFAELFFESCEETKGSYPFDFIFTAEFVLTEKGLKTTFSVKNTGDKVMPFTLGGHPAFNVPMGDGGAFEDYIIEFSHRENQRCPQIDLKGCLIDYRGTGLVLENQNVIPLRHELFSVDALVFDSLNSHTVSIKNTVTSRFLQMTIDEFPMLGIWSSQNSGPFVALEPWTGCATTTEEGDTLEEKRHMTFLNPGCEKKHSFTVTYS